MARQYERFKKEVEELKEKLDFQQKENESLISEIGVIEGEYKTKEAENAKITKHLTQSEDTNINLVSERIKLTQMHAQIQKKNEGLMEKVTKSEQKCSAQEEQLGQCENKISALEEKIRKVNEELMSIATVTDTQQVVARNLTLETTDIKFHLEDSQKEADKMKNYDLDIVEKLEKEKLQNKSLFDDCQASKKRLSHFAKKWERRS